MTIFKGDNSAAFGRTFITININNPNDVAISKAVFKCGCIKREWEEPEFPLTVNFDEEETKTLEFKNVCYLAVWDEQGRKKTCTGCLTFKTNEEVV